MEDLTSPLQDLSLAFMEIARVAGASIRVLHNYEALHFAYFRVITFSFYDHTNYVTEGIATLSSIASRIQDAAATFLGLVIQQVARKGFLPSEAQRLFSSAFRLLNSIPRLNYTYFALSTVTQAYSNHSI
jgi:hypothetical protein